jgi:hypothetical protein
MHTGVISLALENPALSEIMDNLVLKGFAMNHIYTTLHPG